jgi:hypothetical protein
MKRLWSCLLLVSLFVPTGLITVPAYAVIRPQLIFPYFIREQGEKTENVKDD